MTGNHILDLAALKAAIALYAKSPTPENGRLASGLLWDHHVALIEAAERQPVQVIDHLARENERFRVALGEIASIHADEYLANKMQAIARAALERAL